MKAQTRNDLSRQLSDFLLTIASDKEMSDLKHRAEIGAELSIEEEQQYFYHFVGNTRIWENIHYQYRQGMFDELEFKAEMDTWRILTVRNKRFKRIWCSTRGFYSPKFVSEIDNLLGEGACVRAAGQ